MKIVDIHTHKVSSSNKESIEIHVKEFSLGERPISPFDILGVHPWRVNSATLVEILPKLKIYLSENKIWMLGEIGLDRVSEVDFELQKEVFATQVEFAKLYEISRIVVHAVRAYSDILEILIRKKFNGKVLLHDYNSNNETAEQFNKHLDTYYSFGAKLFKENTQAFKVIGQLPLTKVFLETDDKDNLSIEEVYIQASQVLNIDQMALQEQIYDNFVLFSNALFTDAKE